MGDLARIGAARAHISASLQQRLPVALLAKSSSPTPTLFRFFAAQARLGVQAWPASVYSLICSAIFSAAMAIMVRLASFQGTAEQLQNSSLR